MRWLQFGRALLRAGSVGGLLIAGTALAWNPSGGRWQVPPDGVPYLVNETLTSDLDDRDALDGVIAGYGVWGALTCSLMSWRYDGRTENQAWGAFDGLNIASWRESGWTEGSSVLGIASIITAAGGRIEDCDTKYNGQHHTWHSPPASASESEYRGSNLQDVMGVVAHESGHCIGLDHTNVPGSTMLPVASSGISDRSLGADDIEGACALYPSGGPVPDPDQPPPPPGSVDFGGDCRVEGCAAGLFCANDGRSQYCTRGCEDHEECGEGYHCAGLNQGRGACAHGEAPAQPPAGFGQPCGAQAICEAGLRCVVEEESGETYCTGPCLGGGCPSNYECLEAEDGSDVCARNPGGAALPGQGSPCGEDGVCARGLFCMHDPLWKNEETGDVEPYCTAECGEEDHCAPGYRCVDASRGRRGCQKIPTAGERQIGDECWINPEQPPHPQHNRPSCGEGMECVGFRFDSQNPSVVLDKGTCTQNCTPDECCPEGFACRGLTKVFAQCVAGGQDDEDWQCVHREAQVDAGLGEDGGLDLPVEPPKKKDEGGCSALPGSGSAPWPWAVGLLGLWLSGRRRRG